MKILKHLNKSILFVILGLIFLPQIAKADIIPPPTAGEVSIAYLVVFLANLILNFLIFGLAYIIFFKKDTNIFKWGKFFLSLIMVTVGGFIADMIVFSRIYRVEAWHCICLFVLILVIDALVCKFYLKASLKKSIFIGLWMGILTNPIIFYLVNYLLNHKLINLEIFRNILRFGT